MFQQLRFSSNCKSVESSSYRFLSFRLVFADRLKKLLKGKTTGAARIKESFYLDDVTVELLFAAIHPFSFVDTEVKRKESVIGILRGERSLKSTKVVNRTRYYVSSPKVLDFLFGDKFYFQTRQMSCDMGSMIGHPATFLTSGRNGFMVFEYAWAENRLDFEAEVSVAGTLTKIVNTGCVDMDDDIVDQVEALKLLLGAIVVSPGGKLVELIQLEAYYQITGFSVEAGGKRSYFRNRVANIYGYPVGTDNSPPVNIDVCADDLHAARRWCRKFTWAEVVTFPKAHPFYGIFLENPHLYGVGDISKAGHSGYQALATSNLFEDNLSGLKNKVRNSLNYPKHPDYKNDKLYAVFIEYQLDVGDVDRNSLWIDLLNLLIEKIALKIIALRIFFK